MVDETKALLKVFGEGVDALTQIATDKAINTRRQTASTFNMSNGSLLEEQKIKAGAAKPQRFSHGLRRKPRAVFVSQPSDPSIVIASYDATNVFVDGNDDALFSLWVV